MVGAFPRLEQFDADDLFMVGANLWLEHFHGWSIYGWSISTVGVAWFWWIKLWLEQIMVGANLWLEHFHAWSIPKFRFLSMVGASRTESLEQISGWNKIRFGVFWRCSNHKFAPNRIFLQPETTHGEHSYMEDNRNRNKKWDEWRGHFRWSWVNVCGG